MRLRTLNPLAFKGTTLVEVLIVVAILFALLSIVLTKTNALKHVGLVYDIQRHIDTLQLKKALQQAVIEGEITIPKQIPQREADAKWICQYSVRGMSCLDPPIEGIDLSGLVPVYINEIPKDPEFVDKNITGYKIYQDGAFFIIVAPYLDE